MGTWERQIIIVSADNREHVQNAQRVPIRNTAYTHRAPNTSVSETMAHRTTAVRRPLSRSFLLLLLLSSLLWGAAVAGPFGGGDGGPVYRLLVLHTNDMHSRFEQTDRIGGQCVDRGPVPRCYGGFARLKTAVDMARAEAQASGATDGTLFLNAGDTFQGTPIYTYLKWTAVARMVSRLGIDVMVSVNDMVTARSPRPA